MKSRRAICVSRDEIRPAVEAALAAAGLVVEHLRELPAADVLDAAVVVVVIDRATRQAAGDRLRAVRVPVVVIGDDLDDDGLITLMLDAPVSHLVGDARDKDLGITSAKLATGDVFGLEKYVATTTAVGERAVTDDVTKRRAIDELLAWAETVHARRPIQHRLASVVDELLMNALREGGPAILRWAADPTTLAISVGDAHGSLRQRDVLDHVRRARDERGRPEGGDGGAGLGLYLVLANVASLVVNVAPGTKTEVVCLFDLSRAARVRSLHVFSAA